MPSPRSTRRKHAFLIRCAELLHMHGTPAHRLERVMVNMARSLGVEASFLSTPTSVFTSFGHIPDEATHLLRIDRAELDLGKLLELDEVMERVEHKRISIDEGYRLLNDIASAPARWSHWWKAAAFAMASAGAARLFGGSVQDIALSAALGPLLFLLDLILPKRHGEFGVYEPIAAFVAAIGALLVAKNVPGIDDRVVILASMIVLIPGLSLTIAMTELATRHLVSGVSRFAGAAVVFTTLLLGVALAWRLGDGPIAQHASIPSTLPLWSEWMALAVTPVAFAILLEARPREFGVIYATAISGYLCARFTAETMGSDISPFFGALVVGVLSNVYARVANRPALVPLTPGLLLLVPGSLGYRSLTSFLGRDSLAGMEWAFQTGMVAIALVGGTLVANIVLPPRRVL